MMMILYDDDNDLSLFPSYFCGFSVQNFWKHSKRAVPVRQIQFIPITFIIFYVYSTIMLCLIYVILTALDSRTDRISQKTISY